MKYNMHVGRILILALLFDRIYTVLLLYKQYE